MTDGESILWSQPLSDHPDGESLHRSHRRQGRNQPGTEPAAPHPGCVQSWGWWQGACPTTWTLPHQDAMLDDLQGCYRWQLDHRHPTLDPPTSQRLATGGTGLGTMSDPAGGTLHASS